MKELLLSTAGMVVLTVLEHMDDIVTGITGNMECHSFNDAQHLSSTFFSFNTVFG